MKGHAAKVLCVIGVGMLAMAPAASARTTEQCNGNRVLTQVTGSGADSNGDKHVCVKHNEKPKDNAKFIPPPPPTGGETTACPSGFAAETDNPLSTADANGNARVCVNHATGQVQDDVASVSAPGPAVNPGYGTCPTGFSSGAALTTQQVVVDRNENGVVCVESVTSTMVDDA